MTYILLIFLSLFSVNSYAEESACYGTTSKGRLEAGVKLPSKGKNYVSYSFLAEAAGRTYVHSKVKKVIVDAYKFLEADQPDKVFKYAETGFKEGGQFKPHKTHRNGLSVDFMTPVLDGERQSVHLPTHPFNKLGYSIEFDKDSKYDGYVIDYEALAAHIVALDKTARANGIGIWRVIFDPKLQPNLLLTKYGNYIKNNITLSTKPAWVRHDEHYHVDFEVECEKLF